MSTRKKQDRNATSRLSTALGASQNVLTSQFIETLGKDGLAARLADSDERVRKTLSLDEARKTCPEGSSVAEILEAADLIYRWMYSEK